MINLSASRLKLLFFKKHEVSFNVSNFDYYFLFQGSYNMTDKIKLTSDELRLMSLFQSITSATARDCILDERMDRVIFIVHKGHMGLAIGKGGSTIKQLQIVDAKKKGVVVGREGRNAEKARILAKRYFQISNVLIVSGEQTLNNDKQVNM